MYKLLLLQVELILEVLFYLMCVGDLALFVTGYIPSSLSFLGEVQLLFCTDESCSHYRDCGQPVHSLWHSPQAASAAEDHIV